MSEWECGVCGYIHKEGEAPEKCPVCEAPQKMFVEKKIEGQQEEGAKLSEAEGGLETDGAYDSEGSAEVAGNKEIKTWRCSISGYLHKGVAPPEKCPVCEATAEQFEEVEEAKEQEAVDSARRWRCSVCGHIHEGNEPPEKCPVCAAPSVMFVEIDGDGNELGEPAKEEIEPLAITAEKVVPETPTSFLDKIGNLVLKLHLHPITAHFPSGILPAAVVFLALAVYFKMELLENAAYVNFIFVLVMLPVVLFTGYFEWQKRYKGIKTAIFITKIICSIIVLASVSVLVFWRLLDPQVLAAGSPNQLIYLGITGAALAAAGIAGHLGGKLVFGSRGN